MFTKNIAVKKWYSVFSPPSTCIQFKRNSDEFALDFLPPGYRWINLYPDGRLETAVERYSAYVGVFDKNAKVIRAC